MSPTLPAAPRRAILTHLPLIIATAVVAAVVAPHDADWSAWARSWQDPARALVDQAIAVARTLGKGEVAVLFALVLGALGRRRQAAQALVALLVVGLLVTAVKHGVGRLRPNDALHHLTYSFPSGDAATAAAVLAPLICAWRWWAPLPLAWLLMVCYGRVHDGYHYPSDVAAGIAAGALASLAAAGIVARARRLPPSRILLAVAAAFAATWVVATGLSSDGHDGADMRRFLLVAGPALLALLVARWLRARGRRPEVPPARPWLVPVATCLGVGLALLALSTRSTLWDRDEPRFARAAVEMSASGDWLVPTFDGGWRLHKPVGIYWLMAPSVGAFGQHEWAARLPAVLAAMAALGLTWWIGRRLAGDSAARWSMLALATAPLLMVCGSAATTDAVLVAFITAAMAALLARFRGPPLPRAWWILIAGVAIGCALLVKGPLGLSVPLLAAAMAWFMLRRELARGFWLDLGIASLVAIAVFAAWAIPADLRTDGAYHRFAIFNQVVERMSTVKESHGGGPWYYIPVVIAAFFPWTALLPAAFAHLHRRGGLAHIYLYAWIAPTFVLLSLVATKLPHYILPIFPALALTIGLLLAADEHDARERRLLALGGWIALIIGLMIALALTLLPWLALLPSDAFGSGAQRTLDALGRMDGLLAPLLAPALAFATLSALAGRALLRARARQGAIGMVTGMAALALALGLSTLPALERWKPSLPIAQAIRAATPSLSPVCTLDYDEPSLHFYLDRGPVRTIGGDQVRSWASDPRSGVLVLSRDELTRAEADGQLPLREIASASGLDLANGRWYDLVAVVPSSAPR
jgi:membrane-associated phospholipid phosphatase